MVVSLQDSPKITCFLIKVASRCNLNCDYCYVFNHVDQSWKNRPALMSEHYMHKLADRLAEYAEKRQISEFLIVFHGGEPLLMGSEKICQMTKIIREVVPEHVRVDFSLQTNGVVLREKDLELFSLNKISVSLSLDGPKKSSDLHRLTHNGSSSFNRVMNAYNILKRYPDVFTGVIAVVDSRVPPVELFEFFNEIDPPRLDFLIPDANYLSPPKFREKLPGVYQQWLHKAFDLWLDRYPHIPVRFFDNLVAAISGSDPGTDAFGFGDVSLLSIETDGTYHVHDVLKITKDGASDIEMGLDTHSIYEASISPKVQAFRKLLSLEGLCDKCKECPVVDVCAGGTVPHRYDGETFDNPTVYCSEMFSIINHARSRLKELVHLNRNEADFVTYPDNTNFDVCLYNQSCAVNKEFQQVLEYWAKESRMSFDSALSYAQARFPEVSRYIDTFKELSQKDYNRLVTLPYVQLWSYVASKKSKGQQVFDLDEKSMDIDLSLLERIVENKELILKSKKLYIHEDEPWLRRPWGSRIIFDDNSSKIATQNTKKALDIIKEYKSELYDEMLIISPCIQFIQDPTAHSEKLVSFSDNVVPGALYVSVRLNDGFADPYDVADSIIHEHRHQKLYLLEKFSPLIESEVPYVPSPWREEPRPVSGLFHAVFVFVELQSFWVSLINKPGNLGLRARATAKNYEEMLYKGIETLRSTKVTLLGDRLLSELEKIIEKNICLMKEFSNAVAA